MLGVLSALTVLSWLALPTDARSAETVTMRAGFSPDVLGAPTNLSAATSFGSDLPGPQPPVRNVTVYGPAGMSVDTRGAGLCTASPATVERVGPGACPADSRIGFGRADGLQELAGELIPGPFTLEFFLRPSRDGHLAMLIYAETISPAVEQLAFLGEEVRAAKPYGLGLSFAVPVVASIPGASLGWVARVLLTLGSPHASYRRTIGGRSRLLHVKGLTAPRSCPRGGFPFKGSFRFADGSTASSATTIPCPQR